MVLKELCKAAGIFVPKAYETLEILSVSCDSRRVTRGGLFVCIRGFSADGHSFLPNAVANGAVACICEEGSDLPAGEIPILFATDTRRASACIFNAFYGFPTKGMHLIGVTGTNGKTTVTHLIRSVLEASLCRCGLIGTVGCESVGRSLTARCKEDLANMTTPDPEDLYRMLREMADDGVEYVLMEVTSHALALGKLEPLSFDVGVFTNLTPDHLDFHKTMEAYAEAKSELFRKSRVSVLNADAKEADRMAKASAGRVLFCSERDFDADYFAEEMISDERGVSYHLRSNGARMTLTCPIPGRFTVMNSMQAVACARELGFSVSACSEGLSSVVGVKGRMERMRLGPEADFSVLIDYAHTPDALEQLLRTAKDICRHGRTILVFGCGGDRDRSKRPLMGAIAGRYADISILTSDNSRFEDPLQIQNEVLSGFPKDRLPIVIPNRREAIFEAVLLARKGDFILLAGKGHEEYEVKGNERIPFHERKIVKEALAKKTNRKRG